MVKTITRDRWRKYQKQNDKYVKLAWIRNGKRYINENGKAVEVNVTGMKDAAKIKDTKAMGGRR